MYGEADAQQLEYDYPSLPPAEPFPLRTLAAGRQDPSSPSYVPAGRQNLSSLDPARSSPPDQLAARRHRARRPKVPRTIPLDRAIQLRNTDLANMNANYLANMAEVARHKHQLKVARGAKEKADFHVWRCGIGGCGRGVGRDGIPVPTALNMFYGEGLRKALTCSDGDGKREGRKRGFGNADEENGRRVRSREEKGADEMRGFGSAGIRDVGDGDVVMIGDDVGLYFPIKRNSLSKVLVLKKIGNLRNSF